MSFRFAISPSDGAIDKDLLRTAASSEGMLYLLTVQGRSNSVLTVVAAADETRNFAAEKPLELAENSGT